MGSHLIDTGTDWNYSAVFESATFTVVVNAGRCAVFVAFFVDRQHVSVTDNSNIPAAISRFSTSTFFFFFPAAEGPFR
jgi:hypothetical protein